MDEALRQILLDLTTRIGELADTMEGRAPTGAPVPPGQPSAPDDGAIQIQNLQAVKQLRDANLTLTQQQTQQQRMTNQQYEAELQYVEKLIISARSKLSLARKQARQQRQLVNTLKEDLSIEEQNSGVQSDIYKAKADILRQAEDALNTMNKTYHVQVKINEEAQVQANYINEVRSRTESLFSTITQGILANTKNRGGFFGAFFGPGSGGAFKEKMKAIAGGFWSVMNPINASVSILTGMVDKFKELFWSMDSAQAQFRKSTGATGEYNKILTDSVARNTRFAVTVEDGGRAMTELYNNMRGFSGLLPSVQGRLQDLVVIHEKLGVTAQQTGRMQDFLTKAMGAGSNEAIVAQEKIMAYARQIGISHQEATRAFIGHSGALAAHGPNMINVFKELLSVVKRTGVEYSTLMSIANQYETFESAAASVGKLNAILGGSYLNSIRMVNATEVERIQMIAQAVRMSGAQISSMGRFTQKAIAQAMGAKDSAEAMRILRAELGQLTSAELSAAQATEQNRLQAERNLSIQEKLRTIFYAVANAMMPLLESLDRHKDQIKEVITSIAEFIQKHGLLIAKVMIAVPVITTLVRTLGFLKLAFTAAAGASRILALSLGGGLLIAVGALAAAFLVPKFSPSLLNTMKILPALFAQMTGPVSLSAAAFRLMGDAGIQASKPLITMWKIAGKAADGFEAIGKGVGRAVGRIYEWNTAMGSGPQTNMLRTTRNLRDYARYIDVVGKGLRDIDPSSVSALTENLKDFKNTAILTEKQQDGLRETTQRQSALLKIGAAAVRTGAHAGLRRLTQASKEVFNQITVQPAMAARQVAAQQVGPSMQFPEYVTFQVDMDGETIAQRVTSKQSLMAMGTPLGGV